MKTSVLALAAALALFTTATTFAQRGYDPRYGNYPAPNSYPTPNQQRYDDVQDEIRLDRLDAIVGLSRRQERQLRRIEERYDRMGLVAGGRLNPRDYQRLLMQKNQEFMSVLTPVQRDRLYAFQANSRRGNPGRGNYGGYGRRG